MAVVAAAPTVAAVVATAVVVVAAMVVVAVVVATAAATEPTATPHEHAPFGALFSCDKRRPGTLFTWHRADRRSRLQ
jgi:Spy/CpxP family protein refolding chaperone